MEWKVLHSGVGSAQHHMDIDQELLQDISSMKQPLLRFYDWDGPSATYGYFIDPMNFLDFTSIEKLGLKLGRRPTGGGIVFHLTDLAFSVLVPASHPAYSINTLENYAFVNKHVARAVLKFKKDMAVTLLSSEEKQPDGSCKHFCMAKPTIYDVMAEGKKVGGAAQRRTRDGFLHQGTISIAPPEEAFLKAALKDGTQVIDAMVRHSYVLTDSRQLKESREELRRLLAHEFEKMD